MEDDLQQLHWLAVPTEKKKRIVFTLGLLSFKSINGMDPKCL